MKLRFYFLVNILTGYELLDGNDRFNPHLEFPISCNPKLHNDRSHWADYEPQVRRVMGSKGLIPHLEGHARKPIPHPEVDGSPQASKGMDTTEDQIDAKEKCIAEFEQKEYLAQHFITSSISLCLTQKIMKLMIAKDMWDAVTLDATSKSVLHQVDVLTQLQTMKCSSLPDPKVHLAEIKVHFVLMTER